MLFPTVTFAIFFMIVVEKTRDIGILLAMGVVMIPLSIWIFSWAENRDKRLGLLKRSG
mgnify:CR=1 FL=1